MMKKTIIILTLFCVTFACREDDAINGSGVGFYPSIAENGQEEGSTAHTILMEASGVLTTDGTITIGVTNGDFLTTVPPLSGGVISLVMPAGTREVSFDVSVGDDNFAEAYSAVFEIQSVGGGLSDILSANQFTLLISDNDQRIYFSDDFEGDDLCKWITHSTSGSNDWRIDNFADNNFGDISNFGSTGLTEDWLIMPEINFDDFTDEQLTFLSQANFANGNVLEVSVLTDYSGSGDPSGATKVLLNATLDPNQDGFGDFTESGSLDLSMMTGTGHVAFHYTASNEDDGSGWQIDDVVLAVNDPNGLITVEGGEPCGGSGGGSGGGGGGTGDLSIPFTDDFEGCADFAVPENWIEAVVSGSKTDRGWGCRSFGIGDSGAVRASAFGGDEGTDDAWLISDGQFDLTSLTSVELKFWIEERFTGPGAVTVHWSTNYSGSGDPTAATWTELTDAATQITAITAEVFTEITVNLDGAAGNNIHLAFRYAGGTDAASVAYTIDDLSITGN